MIYTEPIARVAFMTKTSLDIFSLRQEHVWVCSLLGDRICDMKRVTNSRQQASTLGEPSTNWKSNRTPKTTFSVLRAMRMMNAMCTFLRLITLVNDI